jgi:hypothetical protein
MSAKSKAIRAELNARAQARAQASAPIVQSAMDRSAESVAFSSVMPSTDSIVARESAIRKLTQAMIDRIPMWARVPCPSWYTRRALDKNGKAINVRNVARWEKEVKAALDYIASGLAPIIKIDGKEYYDIPMPVTVSLMAEYIDQANMNGVLTSVAALMRDVRSTEKNTFYESNNERAFADALIDQLAAVDLDESYAPIVRTADALVKAQKAYERASERANLAMSTTDYESMLKRRDSARTRLDLAQAAFDGAWAHKHTVAPVAPVKAVPVAPTAESTSVAVATESEVPA